MDESCGEATIAGSVSPNPPSEVNRKRRSIQTKLPWVSQVRGGGDVSDGENKGKKPRKREFLRQGSKKSLAACNEASKSNKGSRRSCVLNKRSPDKNKKQEQDAATLKVRSSKRCEATESKYKGLNDNQKTNAAFKDPTSSVLEWKESSLSSPPTGIEFDVTVNLDGRQHLQQPDFNIQLEGNIAVKESIELSTGKQMHQSFTCWEETNKVVKSISVSNRKNYYHSAHDKDFLPGSPIHIFDKVEDEFIELHWQNWVFENKTPDSEGFYAPKHASSIFESSVKPLELDTACHSERHLNQIRAETNFTASAIASSSLLEQQKKNEQLGQLVTDNGGSASTSSIYLPFRYSNYTVDMETEKDHMLIKERLDSYNLRRGNFPESSLWTDKYQPENTLELCGNIRSIRILSEWLKSWDEGPRSNRSFNSSVKEGHHNSYDIESYMDDIDDEAIRKNVLLLTGPIGSGKSAAIHACTKEQGFKVIEVNTSDVRSGALMKQKFGDSIEASTITPSLCLKDNPIGETKKIIPSLSSDIIETDDSFSQRTPENCQQGKMATESTRKLVEEKNTNSLKVKGSIQVFEDVDVVFYEDMGFISAVLQLAEKTKKPIILTSNDKNPILPHLDPLIVDFTVPSSEDLLSHAQMVCAVEGIQISSELLERLTSYCRGDIRKMLLLLQFWCQGTRCQIDDSKRCTYNPLPFDVSSAHLIMPRVIPWDFPCDLSEKIEEEISGSLSLFENLCLEYAKEHIFCTTEMIDSSKIHNYNSSRNRNSKKSILKQKCAFLECTDFSADADGLDDFLDASDAPRELAQQRVKRRRGIILSSQSDDDPSTDEVLPMEHVPVNHNSLILHDMTMPINIDVEAVHNQARASSSMVYESKIEDTICDTFGLQDDSCALESSFTCPIDASKEVGSLPLPDYARQTSANLSDCPSLPGHSRADIDYMNDSIPESNKLSQDNIGYNCEVYLDSVYRDEDVVISHEHEEPQALSRSVVTDESGYVCSNMLAPIESSTPVQQKWQKLKSCREDMKSCLNSNCKDAYLIIKLSSRLTDLISQTDVMINGCSALFSDILDRSLMLSDGSDDSSRDDRQFVMGSTYAQHGFCFYANKCATTGSSFGSQTTVDLAQEMLASSTNVMALGKLLTTPNLSSKGTLWIEAMKIGSAERELETGLSNAILPKVPTRVSMSLKGPAFLEYASFMSQISKSVDSRLAEITKEKQGRRFRAPVHYLNSGQHSLTSEHVKLLSQSFCFKEGLR